MSKLGQMIGEGVRGIPGRIKSSRRTTPFLLLLALWGLTKIPVQKTPYEVPRYLVDKPLW